MQQADVPDVAQVIAAETQALRSAPRGTCRPKIAAAASASTRQTKRSSASVRKRRPKDKEIAFIEHELTGVRELYQKNLVPITRLSQLEREATRLGGERGQLIAATAQAKGKIAELQLQIIQVDQDLSSEVAKEMREIDAQNRRIRRTQGVCARSAQAHGHSRAAGWHGFSVRSSHGGRRDSRRGTDHDDRA